MNRLVKFRGKSLITVEDLDRMEIMHENGWVYGNLISNGKLPLIVGDIADWGDDYIAHEWYVAVEPESVGQYTGLHDINGQELYEGDICKRTLVNLYEIKTFGNEIIGTVKYIEDTYWIDFERDATSLFCEVSPTEIIGNINDHPELLEVTK